MLISVLIVFIICWSPRVLQDVSLTAMRYTGSIHNIMVLNDKKMVQLAACLRMFSYVNSIVNVFIYYITSK